MGDIGPGPLMCIKSATCTECDSGVKEGILYQCVALQELTPFQRYMFGGCSCGEEHPWVLLQGHEHVYCPTCFAPLGDPDAVIKETDEPLDAKHKPVKETELV